MAHKAELSYSKFIHENGVSRIRAVHREIQKFHGLIGALGGKLLIFLGILKISYWTSTKKSESKNIGLKQKLSALIYKIYFFRISGFMVMMNTNILAGNVLVQMDGILMKTK